MARPRVLLTGFGPFPGVSDNPSGWLAETLAADARPADCILYRAVLPTEWDAVAKRSSYLQREIRPRLTIHFGVHTRAKGLRLERTAHNGVHDRADARGERPARRDVMTGSPETLRTRLPVEKLAADLRAQGFDARVSSSCGRYVCNDLYYRSLHWGERSGGDALFVHVPLTLAQGATLAEETLLRAGEAVLRVALQAVGPRSVPPHDPARPASGRREATRQGSAT